MSTIVEITMRLLLSIIVVIGFTFVVVLGLRSFVADLLALTRHRPPSVFDEFAEDDQESEEQESEDRNRLGTSSSSYAVDAQARRTVATDINVAH
jgi:hypothetical protein